MFFIFASLPSKIKWINGYAMSSETRTRSERHKAKRLGRGGRNHLMHIYFHCLINNLELINQSDVDAPKNILK